jgi:hypothetical protein
MTNKHRTSAGYSRATNNISKDWVFGWTVDQACQSAARVQPSDSRPHHPGGSRYRVLVPSHRSHNSPS